ncbi:uncharacterized protein TNCV_71771 [Trichonephila clavipes]|nr:uncharacterized protein TNCV_71771 [Trichonephila clavipes]
MEAAAILWQRSLKECNMCYTCILSDGDSKTFQHLMSLNIYGKGKPIKKEECINHISKRLGTAIKDNCNDVEKMKSASYATLYHCSSTDAKPKHNKCPNGKLSWCFFKRALANEESPESHSVMKTKLTEEVVAKILPVYQRLASNEILSRCTSAAPLKLVALSDINVEMRPLRAHSLFKAAINASVVKSVTASK